LNTLKKKGKQKAHLLVNCCREDLAFPAAFATDFDNGEFASPLCKQISRDWYVKEVKRIFVKNALTLQMHFTNCGSPHRP